MEFYLQMYMFNSNLRKNFILILPLKMPFKISEVLEKYIIPTKMSVYFTEINLELAYNGICWTAGT